MLKQIQEELTNLALGVNFCEILLKSQKNDECEKNMASVYKTSTQKLEEMINIYGWPGNLLVGEKGSNAAYSIARGAANKPDLMRFFLDSLSEAVSRGDAKKEHEASLRDLIRYYEGKPQLLGLFFHWKQSGQFGAEVDNIYEVNKRRKALGLETIQTSIRNHLKTIDNDNSPKNIEQYTQQIDEWARRTGWRQAA